MCSLVNKPQGTLTPNSLATAVCTPGLATDSELFIDSHFTGNVCSDMLTPPPILFYFSVRRKWSHNQNKKSSNTFCLLPPPSLLTVLPTKSYSTPVGLKCDIPACLKEEWWAGAITADKQQLEGTNFCQVPGLHNTQASAMALSLEEFIHTLDLRTLPRVLEIQSGIYFEGKHPLMS